MILSLIENQVFIQTDINNLKYKFNRIKINQIIFFFRERKIMDEFSLVEQCPDSIQCNDDDCLLQHPRCFTGLCIKGLNNNEDGMCAVEGCSLVHLSKNNFLHECEVSSIQGIYRFNICPVVNCKIKQCPFLHPLFVQDYCVKNFIQQCKLRPDENHKHITWMQLKKQVEQKEKNNTLELMTKELEEVLKNQRICIPNLRGLCPQKPKNNCFGNHRFWEKLDDVNLQENNFIQPCTIANSQQQFENLDFYQQTSLLLDDQVLQQLKKTMFKEVFIDVIFIMDLTSSMKSWLNKCKSSILGVMTNIQKQIRRCSLRMGFVGYRDKNDKQNLVYHQLTPDIEQLQAFISKQNVKGGGDIAEDLCVALEKAINLNISEQPDSLLITLLFTDAPCHGKQYHDGVSDDFENVAPGTLENLMKQLYNKKKKNYFTCVKILHKFKKNKEKLLTQKMFNIMQQNFDGLFLSEPSEAVDFENLVNMTLYRSCSNLIQENQQLFFDIDFEKPKYLITEFKQEQDRFKYWQNFEANLKLRKGKTVLQIDNRDVIGIEKGAFSTVFLGFDAINNQKVIIKIPNEAIKKLKENNYQFQKEDIEKFQNQAKHKFLTQSKARQLAYQYRKQISKRKIEGAPPIFFPTPILYTLTKEQKFFGLSIIYGEIYIDLDNINWKKYTTNHEAQDPQFYYYQSFSHFIFEQTLREFTITDLQGKNNILSDPALQSIDNKSLRIDQGNNFQEGIMNFLQVHEKCSFICKHLELADVSGNWQDNTKWEPKRIEGKIVIDAICDGCDKQIKLNEEQYKKGEYEKCQNCQVREEQIEYEVCYCCRKVFEISINQALQIQSLSNKCPRCKEKCQEKSSENCDYCELICKQYLTSVNINNQKITICLNGKKFFDNLECKQCGNKYNYYKKMSQAEYQAAQYLCQKCQPQA